MKKNVFIAFSAVLIVLVATAVFFMYNQSANWRTQDLSKVSDSQIISILDKNQDAKDYMQSHADFKVDKKEILTKDSIIAGQNGPNFKEVYQDLSLENNRYMRVDLMNQAGDKGLITVIDFKEEKVLKAYGILLLKASANQNGQETSPTENK